MRSDSSLPNAEQDIQYRFTDLTQQQYGDLFGIGSNSGYTAEKGQIYLIKPLGPHAKIAYQLTVVAELDDSGPLAAAVVLVHIENKYNNPPIIDVNVLTSALPKDWLPGVEVLEISASDTDPGADGKIDCRLVEDELSSSKFELEEFNSNDVSENNKEYKLIALETFPDYLMTTYKIVIECDDYGNPMLTTTQVLYLNNQDQFFLK